MYNRFIDFILNNIIPKVNKVYNHRHVRPFVHPPYTVLKTTIRNYHRHNVFRLGAALAYYTIFSLPALIIVIVGLVGFFFGEAAVRGEVFNSLVDSLGPDAANQIQDAVINIGTPDTNWWATILGVSFLFFVATGVFYALQSSLNHIFEVEGVPKRVKILEVLMNRVLSMGMVLSIGALLVVSILLNAFLLKISNYKYSNEEFVKDIVPGYIYPHLDYLTNYFLVFLNLGLSVFLIALFFAMLFKILPAVRLKWSYIWAGAFMSAILFWFGQMAMGMYLSRTTVISAYGAAGSLIVILIWVSYSAQLIFLGAEFIIALCEFRKEKIVPKNFVSALQNIKKKRNLNREKKDSLTMHFHHEAPPSHYENRILQFYSEQEESIINTKSEKVEKMIEEEKINEELGFDKDKNIDLS